MTAGRDVYTSASVTANGVAAQFTTALLTATANKFENILFKELICNIISDDNATQNISYGFAIGSRLLIGGSVVGVGGGSRFTTLTGGIALANMFTLTINASGLVTLAPNLTAGFFGSTSKTPVANVGASITGLTDATPGGGGRSDFTAGIVTPISFTNAETLKGFIALDGAGTQAQCFFKIGCTIISDTQQT